MNKSWKYWGTIYIVSYVALSQELYLMYYLVTLAGKGESDFISPPNIQPVRLANYYVHSKTYNGIVYQTLHYKPYNGGLSCV